MFKWAIYHRIKALNTPLSYLWPYHILIIFYMVFFELLFSVMPSKHLSIEKNYIISLCAPMNGKRLLKIQTIRPKSTKLL